MENGITNGTSATEFAPKNTCTNAHVVTFLHRAEGTPAAKGESELAAAYPENAWYGNAVAWADTTELLSGTGSAFVATDNSPRANIVTYLYRNAK